MRRHILGILSCLLIGSYCVMLLRFGFDETQESWAASICMRIGLVLGTIWLAFPQVLQIFERVSPAIIGFILVGALIVAVRPKAILYIGPVLAAIAFLHFVGWLFKPPPPRQPPPRGGSERAGGGK